MRVFVALITLVIVLRPAVLWGDDPILRDLVSPGVQVVEGKRVPLIAPTPRAVSDKNEIQRILTSAAGDRLLEEFLRPSPVAPFNLKMESLTTSDEKRYAQKVDVWFVAYGKLATLRDKKLLDELAATADAETKSAYRAEGGEVTPDMLEKLGVKLLESETEREGFASFSSPLLDRVLVSGVVHTWQTVTQDQMMVSSLLDDRFASISALANRWQSIADNGTEKPSLGPHQPYIGFGGYLAATQLSEPAGALLIEAHVVFHEPEGWFRGANLLRSKLPIAIQEQIRTFRRKLAAAEKQ